MGFPKGVRRSPKVRARMKEAQQERKRERLEDEEKIQEEKKLEEYHKSLCRSASQQERRKRDRLEKEDKVRKLEEYQSTHTATPVKLTLVPPPEKTDLQSMCLEDSLRILNLVKKKKNEEITKELWFLLDAFRRMKNL